MAARQAYANRQYQDLEFRVSSRRTLARNDDDPSAFGELGNVLLVGGPAAGSGAGLLRGLVEAHRFRSAGLRVSARCMIEQHDPLLAAVLTRRLASLPRSIYQSTQGFSPTTGKRDHAARPWIEDDYTGRALSAPG
ncbi:MAG: hypothetical protein MZW92_67605 [Comamonadaceae bacterium]|nr:hypothetical protein [Comamonadaceae bacterium]